MRCHHFRKLLLRQETEPLSTVQARALRSHLARCAACRKEQEALQQCILNLREAGPSFGPQGFSPSRPDTAHLLARIQGELRREAWSWHTVAMGGVAVAGLVTALLLLTHRHAHLNNANLASAGKDNTGSVAPVVHAPTQTQGKASGVILPQSPLQKAPTPQQETVENASHTQTPRPHPHSIAVNGPEKIGIPAIQQESGQQLAVTQEDMKLLNPDAIVNVAAWTRRPSEELRELEVRLQQEVHGGDTFVHIPLPQVAGADGSAVRAATVAYRQERAVVDARLVRKIRLAAKGMPLGDLCQQLTAQTGIQIIANRNVADDKVTLFCNPRPLRDIMRQISGLFGFTWERTGQEGTYAYELTQPLSSQLLEEGLRQKDRAEMLVLLEQQMEPYRKYLGLSRAQVIQAKNKLEPGKSQAAFDEYNRLWLLERGGLVAANMFFRLSPQELDALRDGQTLSWNLSQGANLGLPPQVLEGQEEAFRHGFVSGGTEYLPKDLHLKATLKLDSKDPSRFELHGGVEGGGMGLESTFSVVKSPAREKLHNARIHAKLAGDPALQMPVSLHVNATCQLRPSPHPDTDAIFAEGRGPKVLASDVLEALFKATGRDLIADQFLRLAPAKAVQIDRNSLFDALNQVGDALQMGWNRSEDWILFRTPDFYNARMEEIPEPLLKRWEQARRKNGLLTLEDMVEISQLTDTQLNSVTGTQGAVACYGLEEWPMVRVAEARPHWRFLAQLPGELRQAAFSKEGLSFQSLTPAQQKQFITLSGCAEVGTWPSAAEMREARLQVTYLPQNTAVNAAQNPNALLPGNPVLFLYSYGQPRRYSMVGPFNGIYGLSEPMMQERLKRSNQPAKP